jgi:hypothetical protein
MRSKKHRRKRVETINLDTFTPHGLIYWTSMEGNSLKIRKFVAEYYRRKYPHHSFWISLLKRRGVL